MPLPLSTYISWNRMLLRSRAFEGSTRSIAVSILFSLSGVSPNVWSRMRHAILNEVLCNETNRNKLAYLREEKGRRCIFECFKIVVVCIVWLEDLWCSRSHNYFMPRESETREASGRVPEVSSSYCRAQPQRGTWDGIAVLPQKKFCENLLPKLEGREDR